MNRNFSEEIRGLCGESLRGGMTLARAAEVLDTLPVDIKTVVHDALAAASLKPMTFAAVACDSLIGAFDGDDKAPVETKIRRMKLAQRLVDGGDLELTIDEAKEIKDRVNKLFVGALVPARMAEFLEGN